MNTASQHLMLDIWMDKPVEPIVDQICDYVSMKFNVVKRISHDFTPQGRTIVFILSESHFAVHTYPEKNYITMDIYICNMDIDMHKVMTDIELITNSKTYESALWIRGVRQ